MHFVVSSWIYNCYYYANSWSICTVYTVYGIPATEHWRHTPYAFLIVAVMLTYMMFVIWYNTIARFCRKTEYKRIPNLNKRKMHEIVFFFFFAFIKRMDLDKYEFAVGFGIKRDKSNFECNSEYFMISFSYKKSNYGFRFRKRTKIEIRKNIFKLDTMTTSTKWIW